MAKPTDTTDTTQPKPRIPFERWWAAQVAIVLAIAVVANLAFNASFDSSFGLAGYAVFIPGWFIRLVLNRRRA